MEENMKLDLGLQHNFRDFMRDKISRAEHELGPKQEISPVGHELGPEQENMNPDRVSRQGVGAQHDEDIDDTEEFERAPKKNMVLVRKTPNKFVDFMGVGAQHGDNDDLTVPQEPDPEQVHDHQRDSACSDVNHDARVEMRAYNFLQLLPTGKVERDRPEDRKARRDLDLHPESSLRRLRQEGPESVTLQLGPPWDSTWYPA